MIDLQIDRGKVLARVQGSSLYSITVGIDAVEPARWRKIVALCGGKIDSIVELLQGKLSKAVMEAISNRETGLFPAPKQIHLACSCPDAATMCKHVAAVLYGVGARLGAQPELLFRLRGADPAELVTIAAKSAALGGKAPAKEKRLGADLASVFGIELDMAPAEAQVAARGRALPAKPQARSRTVVTSTKPSPVKPSPVKPSPVKPSPVKPSKVKPSKVKPNTTRAKAARPH